MPAAVIAFQGESALSTEDGKIQPIAAFFLFDHPKLGTGSDPGLEKIFSKYLFQGRNSENLPQFPGVF